MSKKKSKDKGKRKRLPAYMAKLAYLCAMGVFKPGQLSNVDVAHDAWCAYFHGGKCGCSPDIRIRLQVDNHNLN